MPAHCVGVSFSCRKAIASTTVTSGFRAVSGTATDALAPFSSAANMHHAPRPFVSPLRMPTSDLPPTQAVQVGYDKKCGDQDDIAEGHPDQQGPRRDPVCPKLLQQSDDSPEHYHDCRVVSPARHPSPYADKIATAVNPRMTPAIWTRLSFSRSTSMDRTTVISGKSEVTGPTIEACPLPIAAK